MIEISRFYGMDITMFNENYKPIKRPHIHVRYMDSDVALREYEAIFSIPEGKKISGELPLNKTKLVQAWIIIHEKELVTKWELATNGKDFFKIDPLK